MNARFFNSAALLALALSLAGCGQGEAPAHGPAGTHSAHGQTGVDEPAKGPHGGRLLPDGDFAVELAIFEDGVPPEYRAWVSAGGQPVAPADVDLTVTLARLDGEKNRFAFAPQGDFLRGDGTVVEPHSFDVTVEATHAGTAHRWAYASYEGRVQIAPESARTAGIEVETAGPHLLHDLLPLHGRVVVAPDAVRTVSARFPGVVREVHKRVGDRVRAGEVLARVEADESLRVYDLTAPIDGVVTARAANPGEHTGAAPLFTVSDLDQLWAELAVFPRDVARVQAGQTVRITGADGHPQGSGRITRIAPLADPDRQALSVWARIEEPAAGWTPGLGVTAEVLTGAAQVPLAVRTAALQGFRDFTVVFARVGDTYEVRMLDLGRSDGEYTEVLGGLKPGTEYVTAQSYLIKADIEKSGASHDH
jgi:cobalt-zinc-cadmium efflux system membrane fusion protein